VAKATSAQGWLSNKEAKDIVAQIAEKVCHWRDHFEDVGLTANELEALKPSFDC
jgi:hypothetical protein